MEEAGDAQRYQTRQSQSQAFLEQLKARLDKTSPGHVVKVPWQAINCLASNWLKLIRYIERGHLPIDNNPAERASHLLMYI
jgi:hypothetical protein